MAGEPGPFALHPGLKLVDQGSQVRPTIGEPVSGGTAVDLSLVREDRVDPADRLQCQRGWRTLAGSADVGELEEASPTVRPTERFSD
jgi:hypothetical protein